MEPERREVNTAMGSPVTDLPATGLPAVGPWRAGWLWTLTAAWIAVVMALSLLPGGTAGPLRESALCLLPGRAALEAAGLQVARLFEDMLFVAGYALLAWLGWAAMRGSGFTRRASWLCTLAGAVLVAALAEMLQALSPGREPRVGDCFISAAGALAALLTVAAYYPLNRRLPRIFNYEVVSYVTVGLLTTAVNVVLYDAVYRLPLGLPPAAANAAAIVAAWIGAVAFAFAANRLFVFRSRGGLWRELALFTGARLLSLGVDMAGMLLLVNVLSVHNVLAKLLMNIVVMSMNYVFSKRVIFAATPEERHE